MKQLIWSFFVLVFLTSCEENEPQGFTPTPYNHFFQILGPEGEDPFRNWSEEELEAIRIKLIDNFPNNKRAETKWLAFPSIIQNDTATIFVTNSLLDTNYIHYPSLNRIDTIVHQTTNKYDKNGNHQRILQSRFYFNGEFVAEHDFEADFHLKRHLSETNADSLTDETFVMNFEWEN